MKEDILLQRLASASSIAIALGLFGVVAAGDEPRPTCSQIRLMTASGVIGMRHQYTISAHCSREVSQVEKDLFKSKSKNVQSVSIDVLASASWDRKSGEASESIKFNGTSQGTRVATAICSEDPWLKDPPGGPGSCHNINAQATVNAGETPDVLISKVFYLARSVSLDEAQALSKTHPSGPPPAPPPMPTNPPGKAGDRHSGSIGATGPAAAGPGTAPISFPAEDLVSAGKVHVSQGKVMVQTMSAFGPGWGNNAQLLWGEAGVGAVLDMTVDIAIPGTYALQMSMTRAPDYATVSIEVDGKPGPEFVGWAPSVMPPWPFSAGTFPLLPGARQVTLRITGKRAASTGYLVGVDHIVLTRVQ